MHELSLVRGLVDVLTEKIEAEAIEQVERVKISVGSWSHVDPRTLAFAFNVYKKHYPPLVEAELVYDEKHGEEIKLEWFEGV